MLRAEFAAGRIWVFGSVVRPLFHEESDLDLAAEGISPERRAEAWERALFVANTSVDLVFLEEAARLLRERILTDGEVAVVRSCTDLFPPSARWDRDGAQSRKLVQLLSRSRAPPRVVGFPEDLRAMIRAEFVRKTDRERTWHEPRKGGGMHALQGPRAGLAPRVRIPETHHVIDLIFRS